MTKSGMYWWLNEESQKMLDRGYLKPGQTVEQKVKSICESTAGYLKRPDLASKFEEVFARGWASLSSPIWANAGEERGLPISCFTSYMADDMSHIYQTIHEMAMMTQQGGGVAVDMSAIRPKGTPVRGGGTASGIQSFAEPLDATIKNVSQAGVRRGGGAVYCDIRHPDVVDVINFKKKGNVIQTLNTGIKVDDLWMQEMIAGDLEKRTLWGQILQSRKEKGIPYLFFTDTVNNNAPIWYKEKGKVINSSNLCNEICLSTGEDESLVCCLLSMNLFTYEEWKDTDAVELMIYFLDGIMEEFILKTNGRPGFERANKFAREQRALGLGVMGFHSYLQANNISMESLDAVYKNEEIFKLIRRKADVATRQLAQEYGEPELLKGYGVRNATVMALAPTTSSSSILGQVSPQCEPYKSNVYTVDLAKGTFTRVNKTLQKLLASKGKNTDEVWNSIIFRAGSVQHLGFLSEEEKLVFKTFGEISPEVIIRLAAQRQKHIDQGQSVNLMIGNDFSVSQINKWHILAWKSGLKGLYYQRGVSQAKEDMAKMMECVSCSA